MYIYIILIYMYIKYYNIHAFHLRYMHRLCDTHVQYISILILILMLMSTDIELSSMFCTKICSIQGVFTNMLYFFDVWSKSCSILDVASGESIQKTFGEQWDLFENRILH